MRKILVTGGAGFIGSNFILYLAEKYPELEIVNVDRLTYAGNLGNLAGLDKKTNYSFEKADICDWERMAELMKGCDAVVNFAAESHVDNSISSDDEFIRTNIGGVHSLLKAARKVGLPRFVQISTDEVYGSLDTGAALETRALDPSSSYSASKAAAEMICLAYHKTFGLDVVLTRSSNNFGPRQHPEKLIPKTIVNALNNASIPIYASGKQRRNWIYVMDNCEAIDLVLRKGNGGETYNLAGETELENIALVKKILGILGKPESLIKHVADRPGHDFRYAIDDSKIRGLGFKIRTGFGERLKETADWYVNNPQWCGSWKKR
ncbi:dTDP-glucose 4,6-dehydratase [Candidatus Micrarchaeota archaeon CG_4_10_14_0_2_um_filter_60_11]|nr:MAG: dTDP-glucose 4,6-dehydratase [Candidatus Micrarchaeota archaeon CG1_02_60_51]PIN96118.1 MAG: dTDP-glucose 4,6-dehydratase [Candidatus Micrarchaeota archaeon CG10_big_fil_rev_8_21_14_0_10_60_32]PIO01625.1 MAG: dTDP-glucose 4,6-dehydratase [Candidatus Micrarchaeota archaeon CG09_land_8_20_14_0_10_60_16]PIY91965.1 MAG: dTDP-glucose 4,6-dehydratase [Candidatus Micrarchaeota archaeon CG_4_10_14_0_8_um_filter_60_7]PIZ91303.1 MAG: dTDP-glucose 4,6-dehydratase [Candidatus Micrarchaeota archaeon